MALYTIFSAAKLQIFLETTKFFPKYFCISIFLYIFASENTSDYIFGYTKIEKIAVRREGFGAYPEVANTRSSIRMANKTIDTPLYIWKENNFKKLH